MDADAENKGTTPPMDYPKALRRRGWIIVLSLVLIVGATIAYSYTRTPLYGATADLLYQQSGLDQALFGAVVMEGRDPQKDLQTLASLVTVNEVANAVREDLDLTLNVRKLTEKVTATASPDQNILSITATDPDPQLAARIANAFADQFIAARAASDRETIAAAADHVKSQLDGLSTSELDSTYGSMLKDKYETLQIMASMQNGGLSVARRAIPPLEPSSPQPLRDAALAFVVALVVGTGLALLVEYLDKRIKDGKTLEGLLGAPVLAHVPNVDGRWSHRRRGSADGKDSALIGFKNHPVLLEPFRSLRTSLDFFTAEKSLRVIAITSGLPSEGKTTTSVNLSLSLALSGKRVVLVEADLRQPVFQKHLGIPNRVGLSTVLAGKSELADALRAIHIEEFLPGSGSMWESRETATQAPPRSGVRVKNSKTTSAQAVPYATPESLPMDDRLYCLSSGPLPPNPAELLESGRMRKVLQELSDMYEYVIVDTPPILSVSDALTVGRQADGVIVAVRMNATTKNETDEVGRKLRLAGLRVIGIVALGWGDTKVRYPRYDYAQAPRGREVGSFAR
jgi:polysaccharide biosynthesis transport protein